MGEVLSGPQRVCQENGAALLVTHHWTKTGTGTGIDRMTGVGPTAWGRVLGSGAVTSSRVEDDGTSIRSEVEVEWEFVGSEIPGASFTMTRTVSAEDQKDLSSPLHYEARVVSGLARLVLQAERAAQQMATLLTYLREHPRSSTSLVEKELGRWARDLLFVARADGVADYEAGPRNSKLWSAR
jgi:hypothetical protein